MVKIGLEIHIQLKTDTKLFCGCSAKWQGKEPNTNTCEICLGMPGSKPRLNEKAIDYGLKVGLALGCEFPKTMFFSRKNYFYPDMSKNFQITQYEVPIAKNGKFDLGGKEINITRINLEEDPARLVHPESITKSSYVLVDYNRSGVPLCEIVTAPDFREPKEARIFLQELTSVLEYLDVFDSDMEASMRVDANISIGEIRVEVKNITGFKDVQKALRYEMVRQRDLIGKGKQVRRETRTWDQENEVTHSLRTKEEEAEYGYIFEPDLTRQVLSKDKIKKMKSNLPELAKEKIKRYKEEYDIPKDLSKPIVSSLALADIFEKVTGEIDPLFAAKFISEKLKKTLNYNNLNIKDTSIEPKHLSKLLKMLKEGKITERVAEKMLRELVVSKQPDKIFKEGEKMTTIKDKGELSDVVEKVISDNSQAVMDYKAGKEEAFNFLVGQVMKESKGRADPEKVREILKKKL